jgi:hypothetical protein
LWDPLKLFAAARVFDPLNETLVLYRAVR